MAKLSTLGHRIMTLRRQRGLGLVDLSRKIGVAAVTIYYWEMERSRPKPANFEKIAEALSTSVAVLKGEEPMPTEERGGFGSRLRAARLVAGLSQAALAEKVQFRQAILSRWELGLAAPSPGATLKLAAALGVTAEALLEAPDSGPVPVEDIAEAVGYALDVATEHVVDAIDRAVADAKARFLAPAPPTPAVTTLRVMTPEDLQYQRQARAKELRRRAVIHADGAGYYDEDSEIAGTARAKAVNALALADLVEAHWPRFYPNLDIPQGEGPPARVTGLGSFSIGGSPAGQCVDGGM